MMILLLLIRSYGVFYDYPFSEFHKIGVFDCLVICKSTIYLERKFSVVQILDFICISIQCPLPLPLTLQVEAFCGVCN